MPRILTLNTCTYTRLHLKGVVVWGWGYKNTVPLVSAYNKFRTIKISHLKIHHAILAIKTNKYCTMANQVWNLDHFLNFIVEGLVVSTIHCISFPYCYNLICLIRIRLIRIAGSDHLISHCYDRQVACLSVITMAYQVRNLDHFLQFRLTRFRLNEFDCS